MKNLPKVKLHSSALKMIDEIRKPKTGKFITKNKSFDGVKVKFRSVKNEFSVLLRPSKVETKYEPPKVGEYYFDLQIKFRHSIYMVDRIFLDWTNFIELTCSIDKIQTAGFSNTRNYYFQLYIPLKQEMRFRDRMEETKFTSDLGYTSRCGTTANFREESILICCVQNSKREYFLVFESGQKQTLDVFVKKCSAIQVGLGYLSGYFAGDQGFYFARTRKNQNEPTYFRCLELRDSINSRYTPTNSNPYSYLYKDSSLAAHYQKLLRPVSIEEFSVLCTKLHSSVAFSSALLLILEASIASLLFMPGGYAIALESLSDIIIGNTKLKLAPIKNKTISKKMRKEFLKVLDDNCTTILSEDLKTLRFRIESLNQATNKARLKAPFDLLCISLVEEDLKILNSRNDLLHGRVPDLRGAGKTRSTDSINKDLYYSALRLYTLLSLIILKSIGYDNLVLNYPKIHESTTEISLIEEPYRQV